MMQLETGTSKENNAHDYSIFHWNDEMWFQNCPCVYNAVDTMINSNRHKWSQTTRISQAVCHISLYANKFQKVVRLIETYTAKFQLSYLKGTELKLAAMSAERIRETLRKLRSPVNCCCSALANENSLQVVCYNWIKSSALVIFF